MVDLVNKAFQSRMAQKEEKRKEKSLLFIAALVMREQRQSTLSANDKSRVLRWIGRGREDKAVQCSGHVPHIICLPDCHLDLILFKHEASGPAQA